jgi:hypothetical protein
MRVIVRATEAILLAHGFTNAMLDAMVQDGMAQGGNATTRLSLPTVFALDWRD